jgi:N-6 DNA Methylase
VSEVDGWIGSLGYNEVPGALLSKDKPVPLDHPFASEIEAMFNVADDVGASAVLCIDRVPTVCLLDAEHLSGTKQAQTSQVRRFCERLWNQNLARIVLVAYDESLEAWSVDDPKAARERILPTDTDSISDFSFQGLLSGEVLKHRSTWFDPHKRVDKTLLDNVGMLVKKLTGPLPANTAREITASVIFVAYLEDRGIITDAYRESRRVSTLIELLEKADTGGIEKLFGQLQKDFNGDFLAPDGQKDRMWRNLPASAFGDLHQFLGRTVLRSGQTDLWRYNFAQIPIELIAGIYETFLGQKAKAETAVGNSATGKRKQGAYYTPRLLSDWVVEQALEGLDPLKQRIFDGACGSGMLLTAAFRRLMRAQRFATKAKLVGEDVSDFSLRCDLLLDHIFGSDIDDDARRLTAFSLYLALLSDLAPRDLELLRQGGHQLPSLKKNIRSNGHGNYFSDKSEVLNKGQYTVFISNPPWREMPPGDAETLVVEAWANRQSTPVNWPKRQIAAAFALAAADSLASTGRLAMVLPISLFISAERSARRFRANLLSRYRIDRITNFADMRHLIFVDADHPFVVMVATRRTGTPGELSGEQFEYWTPKTDISLALGRLTLHGADRSVLAASALIDEAPQLSLRYWGTLQDLSLLERMWQYGTVNELRVSHGWEKGKGFHRIDNDKRVKADRRSVTPSEWLRTHKFLQTNRIPSDLPIVDKLCLERFPYEEIARESEELRRSFKGPRVIWPDGTHPEKGVKAVFADSEFSFLHSVGVLSAPDTELGRLEAQFVTAYMRSPLGTWLSLLLSPSVAAERPKLHVTELRSWPYWPAAKHPQPKKALEILKKVDRIFSDIERAAPMNQRRRYADNKAALDGLVFDYFGLRAEEKVLVKELAAYAGPSLQPSSLTYNMLVKPMRKPPSSIDIDRYCRRLVSVLVDWRDATGGKGEINATPWTARSVPIGGVVITLPRSKASRLPTARLRDDTVISELLSTVTKAVNGSPEQLLSIPDVIAVEDNRITVIKPLVMRFWLERAAIEDANKLVVEIAAVRRAKGVA